MHERLTVNTQLEATTYLAIGARSDWPVRGLETPTTCLFIKPRPFAPPPETAPIIMVLKIATILMTHPEPEVLLPADRFTIALRFLK